mmetsp:Transcript_16925/g.50677  ORF Transcript_16925/g.50677 Transcript_16925/m.50677 type:complete len:470 (+) Transcript_16925:622-2031(+)
MAAAPARGPRRAPARESAGAARALGRPRQEHGRHAAREAVRRREGERDSPVLRRLEGSGTGRPGAAAPSCATPSRACLERLEDARACVSPAAQPPVRRLRPCPADDRQLPQRGPLRLAPGWADQDHGGRRGAGGSPPQRAAARDRPGPARGPAGDARGLLPALEPRGREPAAAERGCLPGQPGALRAVRHGPAGEEGRLQGSADLHLGEPRGAAQPPLRGHRRPPRARGPEEARAPGRAGGPPRREGGRRGLPGDDARLRGAGAGAVGDHPPPEGRQLRAPAALLLSVAAPGWREPPEPREGRGGQGAGALRGQGGDLRPQHVRARGAPRISQGCPRRFRRVEGPDAFHQSLPGEGDRDSPRRARHLRGEAPRYANPGQRRQAGALLRADLRPGQHPDAERRLAVALGVQGHAGAPRHGQDEAGVRVREAGDDREQQALRQGRGPVRGRQGVRGLDPQDLAQLAQLDLL